MHWKSWILKKKEVTVTTWKFRLLALFTVGLIGVLVHRVCLEAVATSLLHEEALAPADVLLLENFDPDYFVFEAGRDLLRRGYSSRVLIPVVAKEESLTPRPIEQSFVEVMSRNAGVDQYEILPVHHVEPIALNVALQVAEFLESNGIRSVIIVAPGYRSARSFLVYERVLTSRDIRIQCFAARTAVSVNDWWHTRHGTQGVGLEFLKLLYYRFWVMVP